MLAGKGNQGQLYEEIDLFLRLAQQNGFERVGHIFDQTVNKDHGRSEFRECWAMSGAESLQLLRDHGRWKGLQTMAMFQSQRQINDTTTIERRYYISSLATGARKILHAARSHWGVENSLHWVLNLAMDEDNSRIRKDNMPENMATLRRITLNLLKQERSLKRGIQGERLKATLSPDYLPKLLTIQYAFALPVSWCSSPNMGYDPLMCFRFAMLGRFCRLVFDSVRIREVVRAGDSVRLPRLSDVPGSKYNVRTAANGNIVPIRLACHLPMIGAI